MLGRLSTRLSYKYLLELDGVAQLGSRLTGALPHKAPAPSPRLTHMAGLAGHLVSKAPGHATPQYQPTLH